MNKRQYLKRLKKALLKYRKHKGKKFYTCRGVDENGCLVVLGFTCKPKQEGCNSYVIKYIEDMLHFHGNSAYEMFRPINTRYADKYYNKKETT
jgi:hypothetical protein